MNKTLILLANMGQCKPDVKYSGGSLIGKAVTNAYNRWDSMIRSREDGRIKIGSNLMENTIRPVALGRKRSAFGRFAMQRTICSAAATREHRIWPSSARLLPHARRKMSTPGTTSTTSSGRCQGLYHREKRDALPASWQGSASREILMTEGYLNGRYQFCGSRRSFVGFLYCNLRASHWLPKLGL